MGGGLILPKWLVLDFTTVSGGSTRDTTKIEANCYQILLERWMSHKKAVLPATDTSDYPVPLSYPPWQRRKWLPIGLLLSGKIMWTTVVTAGRQAYGLAAQKSLLEVTNSAVHSWMVWTSGGNTPTTASKQWRTPNTLLISYRPSRAVECSQNSIASKPTWKEKHLHPWWM